MGRPDGVRAFLLLYISRVGSVRFGKANGSTESRRRTPKPYAMMGLCFPNHSPRGRGAAGTAVAGQRHADVRPPDLWVVCFGWLNLY